MLQDLLDTTPNVHREPVELSISGTLSAVGPVLQLPTFGFRFDLLRLWELELMADQRKPIMVVTPRVSIAAGFIQSLQRNWSPADGESINVTVQIVEARILSPLETNAIPDTVSMESGNVSSSGGGAQGGADTGLGASGTPVSQVPPIH